MKRSLTAGGVLLALGLALGACSETGGSASAGFGPAPRYASCRQYVSCGSCTPISGCGWCYLPDGTGKCVEDPDECSSSSAFSWTWDPKGCRVTADAAVGPLDAGRPVFDAKAESSVLDAAARDAPAETSDDSSEPADVGVASEGDAPDSGGPSEDASPPDGGDAAPTDAQGPG
jgi:hypothetical protein